MSYLDDKIKVLEMICAEMLPWEVCEGNQHVVLDEDDFQKEGFSFNSAIMILKDIFSIYSINKFEFITVPSGKRTVSLTVGSDLESYTRNLKYPETQFLDDDDYLNPRTVSSDTKISIVIDERKGIYRSDKPELCYKIKTPSKRFSVIKYLSQKDKISISELEKEIDQKQNLLIKEIRLINSSFRKELSVAYDLILHADTSGYFLNRDKFDINL